MEQNRYVLLVLLAMLASLAVGLVGGIFFDRQVLRLSQGFSIPMTGAETSPEDMDMDLIREAWETIDRIYVNRQSVKPRELTYGAISGMVDALGDTGHSRFLTPEMVRQENSFTQGELEGIGVEVQVENGQLVIVTPIDGSPAQRAGLRPGDVIQKVDGDEISGKPLEEMVAKIKGPAGTSVTLTVLAEDGQTREVTVERARIPVKNVDWQQIPGTTLAHLRISAFTRGVGGEMISALKEIKEQKLSGVVLDMRNNPGGLLQESLIIASQFLSGGNVMKSKDAQGLIKSVPVLTGGVAQEIPLVVLVNEGSASASEIVAGALQDAGRAAIVGETTFGTGTVLNQFNLSDGSALLLATEEWLTPTGRVIWHKGIQPDVAVSLPDNASLVIPSLEAGMSTEQLQDMADAQLFKAMELLGQPMTANSR